MTNRIDQAVNIELNLTAGENEAVEQVDELSKALAEAKKSLSGLGETGSLGALGIDAEGLSKVNVELELMAANTRLVERQLSEARVGLEGLDVGSEEFERQSRLVLDLTKRYDTYLNKLKETPAELAKASQELQRQSTYQRADVAGTGATALAQLGGLTGADTGALESILDVSEAIPKLGVELSELGAKALESGKVSGVAAAAISALPPGMQATAAGAATLLASLGPLILVGGAVAGAIALVNRHMEEQARLSELQAELTERNITAAHRQAERQAEINDLILAGDVEGLEAKADASRRDAEIANNALAELEHQKAQYQEQLTANDAAFFAARDSLNIEQANALREEGDRIRASLDQVQADIDKTTTEVLGPALEDTIAYWEGIAAAQQTANQNALIDAIAEENRVRAENARLIETATSQQIADTRKANQQRIDQINAEIDAINASGVSTEYSIQTLADLRAERDALIEQDVNLARNVEPLVAAREAETAAVNEQLDAINTRISQETELAALLRDGTSQQIEQRLQALADEKAAIESQLPELRALAATSEEAATRLAELEGRLVDIDQQTTFLSDTLGQVQLREQAEGLKELSRAIADTEDKIVDLRAESTTKLADLEKKLSDTVDQIAAKRLQAIQSENANYFKEEREAWAAYRQEVLESDNELKDERLRIVNNTLDQIFAAEQANDVVALARAKAEGQKALTELDDKASKEQQQRDDQFFAELERLRTTHEERLAQIDQQAIAERDRALAAHQQQVDAEQARINERVQAEEAALRKTLNDIQTKYELEQDLINSVLDARAERYREDGLTYDAALAKQSDQKIRALIDGTNREIQENQRASKAKQTAEITSAQQTASVVSAGFINAANTISSRLALLNQQIAQIGSGGSSGGSSAPPSGGGIGPTITVFGNEGMVNKPTLSILGDGLPPGWSEAAIRFRESEGLPRAVMDRAGVGGAGGFTLVIENLEFNGGNSGITESQLMEHFNRMGNMLHQKMADGFARARSAG